jgi:hypothetical protein
LDCIGLHKLDRWKLVISGCIDGHTRLACWLSCDDNNRADTVRGHFLEATSRLGWPSRARTDRGGENYGVCKLMLEVRGLGRGSHIAGRSVHNQRIERLWVDVWKEVTQLYYRLFYYLESLGLDIEDAAHLFCLHYVFVPRINRDLQAFIVRWNNHPISTEHSRSPKQIFMDYTLQYGMLQLSACAETPRARACLTVLVSTCRITEYTRCFHFTRLVCHGRRPC